MINKSKSVQQGILFLGVVSLALLAAVETLLFIPVSGWYYLCVAVLFALGLFRWGSLVAQRDRAPWFAACLILLAGLHFVPWSSRKPFLRDLHRIRPGMTEVEARRIMARYVEGTGWPSPVDGRRTDGSLQHDLGATPPTNSTPQTELALRDALVFRHSTHPAFNSDWGIVKLKHGRVTGVSFSPD